MIPPESDAVSLDHTSTQVEQPPAVPASPPKAGPPPVPTSGKRTPQAGGEPSAAAGFDYEDFDTEGAQAQPFSNRDFPAPVESVVPISIDSMEPDALPSIPVEAMDAEPGEAEPDESGQKAPSAPVSQKATPRGEAMGPRATSPSTNGIGDIYSSSSWETEVPLDLASFEVSIPPAPAQSQKIGKIVGISTGVFFLLLLFVMIRNDWSLSLAEFPSQVAFAFSGGTLERLPDAVKELEATVDEDRQIMRRGGKSTLLVVKGLVFNNDVLPHSHVELRGRLVDESGDMRKEVRFACDKFFDDRVLQEVADGQVSALYQKGGEMHNCLIAPDSQSSYWLVFEGIPADYTSAFKVEVKPVSSK